MTLRDLEQPDLQTLAVELDGEPVPGLRMTEKEFEAWCDEDTRAEWVDGEVILMSPANDGHVDLNAWLISLLRFITEADDLGLVRFDMFVRLAARKTRRIPDVFFVSRGRQSILKRTLLDGAPDIAIEIVSPDSEARDWRDKYLDYEKSGVREYWIIDPNAQRVEAYLLGRDKKYHRIKETAGRIHSKVIRKLHIRPQWLWKSPLPKVASVLKELGVRL